jgi:two-component system, chemotaxis family, CheB/CheR fusion protein
LTTGDSTFVVGIGASAGGLEAAAELLGALPAATDLAFILVQHLDPSHESLLSEILAKKTAIPVSVARAGEVVRPGHVYVIPADAILTVHDRHIQLKRRTGAGERPAPVDLLFKSLAATYADRAIGVVLSGGDADGALGICEIKHAGGFTLAQRPELARFPNMPQHAIDTGCVDLVLRPKEIAGELVRLSRRLPRADSISGSGSKSVTDAGIATEDGQLGHVFQQLRSVHGVDFTHYKRTTIKRRLERRMTLRRIESLDEYRALIDTDPREMEALYQDFLIRVTEFFRDPDSFEALGRYVLPGMCESRSARDPIRIWIPGCATGEEAYSVAIALLEHLGDRPPPFRIQIFGTDVSEAALQKARAGVYPANVLHEVSAERLERFFVKDNSDYRVAKEVRDLCLFARQDVTRDPPFSRLDLISCRNLLIYLDDSAQRRIVRTFHYALRPQGMLFLGPAESVGQWSDLFEQADKRFRVFRRMPNTGPGTITERTPASDSQTPEPEENGTPVHVERDSLPREADRLLLARFAPACLVVNQALTILQFRGHTGPYLEPAGGPPSFDLRRVIRPELLVEILPAIQETSTTGVSSRRDVRLDDGRDVSIEIISLAGSTGARSFLIIFDDGSRPARGGRVSAAPAVSTLPESEKDRRLAQMEREIEGLRDYVRAAIDEHSTIQEELKSAHEEMLSANEEFQSTNEELETSKEELQSTNEELTSTIEELRSRNQELAALNVELDRTRIASERARLHADIIIETVREPLAVLDETQRILRVNSAFCVNLEVPRVVAEGRLLRDIDDGRWNIPELQQRLGSLLIDAEAFEDWEVTVDFRRQGPRVMSLSARRIPGNIDRTEQLLVAFEDITTRSNLTAGLLADGERKDQFIALLGHELRHPLTPITHAIYLLKRRNPDPAAAELLHTIDAETQRLLRFVNELLDVERIGRGLIEVRRERLDVVAVVRGAVDAFQPFIVERRQTLALNLPATPIYVEGDSGRLGQVVTNLVENATKYTEPGGQIVITLERRHGAAVLRVRDNGIGIAAEDLQRVFEPFTKSRNPLANASSGLGLGLSLVRQILDLHRGDITATSAGVAKGSEFVVTLPVAAAGNGDDSLESSVGATPAPLTLRTRRVLIVDDHEEVGESIARLVRTWGHEVAIVRDGPSALSMASGFQPECAIVDLSLPGMSGIELARRLREVFPPQQLYMIALTGYAGAAIREACLAAGFDIHLVKPGEIDLLEELLGAERPDSAGTVH